MVVVSQLKILYYVIMEGFWRGFHENYADSNKLLIIEIPKNKLTNLTRIFNKSSKFNQNRRGSLYMLMKSSKLNILNL